MPEALLNALPSELQALWFTFLVGAGARSLPVLKKAVALGDNGVRAIARCNAFWEGNNHTIMGHGCVAMNHYSQLHRFCARNPVDGLSMPWHLWLLAQRLECCPDQLLVLTSAVSAAWIEEISSSAVAANVRRVCFSAMKLADDEDQHGGGGEVCVYENAMARLIETLRGVREGGFHHMQSLRNGHLPWLRCWATSVEKIFFQACPFIDEAGLMRLPAMTGVRALDLSLSARIGDKAVAAVVRRFPRLTYLNLSYCGTVTGRALKDLCSLPLEELRLDGCVDLSGSDALHHLGSLTTLRALSLVACKLANRDLLSLRGAATALPPLTSLDVSKNGLLGPSLVSVCTEMFPRLQALYAADCPLVVDAVLLDGVSQLAELKRLSLHGCERLTGSGLRSLVGLPSLQWLDVGGTQINDEVATSIATQLQNLQYLNLNACQELSANVKAMIAALIVRWRQQQRGS